MSGYWLVNWAYMQITIVLGGLDISSICKFPIWVPKIMRRRLTLRRLTCISHPFISSESDIYGQRYHSASEVIRHTRAIQIRLLLLLLLFIIITFAELEH